MKRLFLLAATAAVLATSCEKHDVRNEVINEIGFTSNVGKQTKAIYEGAIKDDFTFGMLAVSKQGTDETSVTQVMPNIEISKVGGDWKATSGSYFWPNNDNTTITFGGYYPYTPAESSAAAHEKLNGTIAIDHTNGLTIDGYEHKNMYVDMMIADAVKSATFEDQDGTVGNTTTASLVPVVLRHVMSQIQFNIALNGDYTGVTYTLKSITLKNIRNKGNVAAGVLTATSAEADKTDYTVYPAATSGDNMAPASDNITSLSQTAQSAQAVTMIPQELNGKSITVVYSIAGTGVATETVTKTINFGTTDIWEANKVYIYNLTIGMNEIKFNPSVVVWDETEVEKSYNVNTDGE